jgi:pimeloyl-ACP methyl ester carboxylesterase
VANTSQGRVETSFPGDYDEGLTGSTASLLLSTSSSWMDFVDPPANQTASNPLASSPPEPAEPCPTPLSTAEVFDSFDRQCTAWEVETNWGMVQGQSLGEGPPLYFLNSLEGTSELFRLLAWLLREEFRCVLFDARRNPISNGKTASDPASVPEVRQLFAVADFHKDDSFLAYGSGFGGWVALAGMLTEPERFHGAILQGGYAERNFKILERVLLFLGKRSKRLLQDVPGWKTIFEQNHRRWFPPFDAPRWEIFQHIAGHVSVKDLAHRARQIGAVRFANRLGEITAPVLCLKSEGEGRMLRQQQEALEQALPNCQAEWLQDSGRVPHWTHPHRVAKIIRQFAAPVTEPGQRLSSSV